MIRPRTDWQSSAQPVVGPAMVLSTVTMLPAHYTAAATVPSDTASYLRSIQNDYTVNRGYSIGYNFAIDQAGVAWECRGFDIKCAANKGMNEVTIAVLCLVDGAEAMNEAMVRTFRQLGAEAQHHVGASLLVVGHRDIGSTACPGDGIYGQVVAGDLEPGTPPVPQPPQPPEDDDMLSYLFRLPNGDVGIRTPIGARRVSGGELTAGPLTGLDVWPVPAGSADEARILAELRSYDQANP